MPSVTRMKELLEVFEKKGLGDSWLSADHEVIYLPGEQDDPELVALAEGTGPLFWDEDVESWATFT